MTLYIEYVLIDNLVIDYLLLSLIEVSIKSKFGLKRKICATLIGVISAIFLPFIYKLKILVIIYKILTSCLMVLVLQKYTKFKKYFFNLGLLYLYTFLFGGVLIAVLNIFQIEYTISGVMLYNFELPVSVFLVIMCLGGWLLKKIIIKLSSQIKLNNLTCKVTIIDNGIEASGIGFVDSGNMISRNGQVVNVISSDMFFRLHKDYSINKLLFRTIDQNKLKDASYIEIKSLERACKYLTFKVDKIIIDDKVFDNSIVAVALKNFDNFDCIINSKLIGEVV